MRSPRSGRTPRLTRGRASGAPGIPEPRRVPPSTPDCPRSAGNRVGALPRLCSPSMADDVVLIEAAGREVPITNPGKVYFNERGDTKLDLVRYYQAVEEPLLRAMAGRPVLLQRFPNGASGP